jgi:hypothetical protein
MARRVVIGLAFVAAALVTYLVFFRVSDEEKIRRNLDALADAVRIEPRERDPAARPLRIRRTFQRVLAPRVQIAIEGIVEDAHPPDELAGMAISAAETFADLTVRFERLEVHVDGGANSASAVAVAIVTGTDHDGDAHREVRPIRMRFAVVDDAWRMVALTAEDDGPPR